MTLFRLLIVDDHPVVLAGLRLLVAGDCRFELAGEAMTAADARNQADKLQPDLIVADLAMSDADGVALVEDLVAIAPQAAVLVYSSHDEQTWAPRALRAGARGFVSKAQPLDTVAVALTSIVEGGIHVSDAVQKLLVVDFADGSPSDEPAQLSAREQQVLRLMGSGYGLQELSLSLGLSVKTVGTYRERLKIKLGLESVRMLERVAHEHVAKSSLRP